MHVTAPPASSALLWGEHPRPEAAGTKPAPYQFGNDAPRIRKCFYDWSDAEVDVFCEAVSYMRDGKGPDHPLPVHDPLQWDNLVATHAHHCTEASDPEEQVHWSWYFLPWHRAFLFFIERHVAQVIEKVLNKPKEAAGFALPYWDRTTHKGIPNTRRRGKNPSPFFGLDLRNFDPSPAGSGDPVPHNLGLYDGYRGPSATAPEMDPDKEDVQGWKDYTRLIRDSYTTVAQIDSFLSIQNFCVFAGFPAVDRQTGQGLLENIPHNTVHDWVGSRFGNNRDMGYLRYAALDPVFYLHHANLDWIWSRYNFTPMPPGKGPASNCATEAQIETWWGKKFTFLDVDGSTKVVTVRDTLTKMKNITYLPPDDRRGLVAMKAGWPQKERSAVLSERTARLTDTPATFTPGAGALRAAGGPDIRAGKPVAAVIRVEVGDFFYARRFQVRVFANKPDADAKTPLTDDHFVGSFQALDSHAGGKAGGTHIFLVNVSPGVSNFYKVAPAGKPFTLTLVPLGTSSRGKPFFLQVKRIALTVFE